MRRRLKERTSTIEEHAVKHRYAVNSAKIRKIVYTAAVIVISAIKSSKGFKERLMNKLKVKKWFRKQIKASTGTPNKKD